MWLFLWSFPVYHDPSYYQFRKFPKLSSWVIFFYLTQFNRHKLWCPAKRARKISLYLSVVLSPLIHIRLFKNEWETGTRKLSQRLVGLLLRRGGKIGNLSNNDGVSNENRRQKCNRFRLAKQQLCTSITLFCTFLSLRRTTTTWKYPIWRFIAGRNIRQQLCFSFPELWYSSLEFNCKKNCPHLTN